METGATPTFYAGNGGNNDGFGGSGIWAVLLLALLGGGCGFGGRGGCDNNISEAVDNAELNARFNSMERQIDSVNDLAQIRANYKEICDTHMGVLENRFTLGSKIDEAKFDNAIIAKDAQLSAQECCYSFMAA